MTDATLNGRQQIQDLGPGELRQLVERLLEHQRGDAGAGMRRIQARTIVEMYGKNVMWAREISLQGWLRDVVRL